LELLIYAYMTKISTCHEIDFAQVSLLKDTENLTFSESNGFQICSKFEETDGHMHTLWQYDASNLCFFTDEEKNLIE
jgi:hypothetical protein